MDDVIVVGAGPAGNNTALGLASEGYSVTVIDSRYEIGDKLCTGLIGRECANRFPIDPSFIYREPNSARLVAPGAGTLFFETAKPQACVVDRVAYVASFAQRAREAGATYLLGQRVEKIISQEHGVTVITGEGSHQARAVVLATGFGSPLVKNAGLGTVSDYVTGVQAVVSTDGKDDVEVHLGGHVAPGFFSWLVPTSPGRALVGLLSRKKAQTRLTGFIQQLRQDGKINEVVDETAKWGIPLRSLKHTYQDRMLVVGDAAGQVKPTTGGGIYYSLLASEAASQVLSEALADDDLSSGNLSRYQSRWQELLADEMEVGYSARRLYEFLSDQQIGSLVKRAGANGFNSELVDASEGTFDWHSKMIGQIMGNPGLGGALRMINPLLARLAHHPENGSAQPEVSSAYRD